MIHFAREEWTASQVAARAGIANEPDERQWSLIEDCTDEILDPARDAMGFSVRISSGYRCPDLNEAIGGAPKSDHMILGDACAADLKCASDAQLRQLFGWLYVYAPWSKLIWEFDAWVHVSYTRSLQQGRHALRASRGVDGKTVYTLLGLNDVHLVTAGRILRS